MILIIYRNLVPYFGRLPALENGFFKGIFTFIKIVFFFQLVSLGWLLFRANSPTHAIHLFHDILTHFDLGDKKAYLQDIWKILFFIWLLIFVEMINHLRKSEKAVLELHPVIRGVFYFICFYLILIFGVSGGKEFVYFQF